ncbi:MAG: polymer-forming cytoskeletal protein [Verrucomicrobiota bacterium]|nr:polymer-forming cytoskeletal protein [Verrucomicrobiota bacterium]
MECPHCGFKQMEYAAARNTLCRQCGKHFVVAASERTEAPKAALELGGVVDRPSLLQRLEGMWNRPRITSVTCFDCGTIQELNSAASSTICPACSVHMDVRDYKINTAFSRAIRTHGQVHVTSAGDLSSSSVLCRSAIIDGKLRGSLQCSGKVEFRAPAKVQGKVSAPEVIIGKKADVQFFRRLQVGSIEIRGKMSGEIVAETVVTIRSTGSLDGNVVARSINVEKGGTFTGELVIGEKNLEQAELIPGVEELTKPRATAKSRPPPHPFGLPATS